MPVVSFSDVPATRGEVAWKSFWWSVSNGLQLIAIAVIGAGMTAMLLWYWIDNISIMQVAGLCMVSAIVLAFVYQLAFREQNPWLFVSPWQDLVALDMVRVLAQEEGLLEIAVYFAHANIKGRRLILAEYQALSSLLAQSDCVNGSREDGLSLAG